MVTVIYYAVRETKDGREFVALIMQGGLAMVQLKQTGNFYATVKKTSVPSTFDEFTAKAMIGERVPGSIQKKACDPYSFVAKETGEIVNLDYRWVYVTDGGSVEDAVFEGQPEVVQVERKPQPLIAGRF